MENKFHPYTEAEYNELKGIAETISTHIPQDKVDWVWNNHNRILGTQETKPCYLVQYHYPSILLIKLLIVSIALAQ